MNTLIGYDLVPEPKILDAALRACRRLDDLASAVRILEAVKVSAFFNTIPVILCCYIYLVLIQLNALHDKDNIVNSLQWFDMISRNHFDIVILH